MPTWRKFVNIPNAIFAVSIILILIYFLTMPNSQPSVNAKVIDTPKINKPKLLEVYYFYDASNCSKCVDGKAFMDGLRKKYLSINLRSYEMSYDPDNKAVFDKFLVDYSVPKPYVSPTTFIDGKYFKDFSNGIGNDIEVYINELLSKKS